MLRVVLRSGRVIREMCHLSHINNMHRYNIFILRFLLERLIGRSIDVRKVEHEQVDASQTEALIRYARLALPLSAIVLAATESLLVE